MSAICQPYIQFIAWPDTQPHAIAVEDRDVSKVVMPDRYTYAFCFFELIEETVEINGEQVKLTSGRMDESPIYYYGAKVYTPTKYAREKPVKDWKKILQYVKEQRWSKFMILCTGEAFRYNGDEQIVPSPEQ